MLSLGKIGIVFATAIIAVATLHTNAFAAAENPKKFVEEINDVKDLDNGKEVADSGNEGNTSAAQESDQ